MRALNFSARTAPSSAFGTFSPAEKRGGEGSRRYTVSAIHSDSNPVTNFSANASSNHTEEEL